MPLEQLCFCFHLSPVRKGAEQSVKNARSLIMLMDQSLLAVSYIVIPGLVGKFTSFTSAYLPISKVHLHNYLYYFR